MFIIVIAISVAALILAIINLFGFSFPGKRESRKETYRKYLESEAWQRKRYVVLRRDNWRCVRCGGKATQVHHLKYAKYNIGKEPIEWLISLCKSCHEAQHPDKTDRQLKHVNRKKQVQTDIFSRAWQGNNTNKDGYRIHYVSIGFRIILLTNCSSKERFNYVLILVATLTA